MGSSRLHDHLNNSHLLPIHQFHQSQRLRKDERDLDTEEENWFNDDGDENKISLVNHGTVFNGGSDDEDSQPETAANSSAISTTQSVRLHHILKNSEDDQVSTASTEKTSSKNEENHFFSYTTMYFVRI